MATEIFTLYSETHDALPDELLELFAEKIGPGAKLTRKRGKYHFRWPKSSADLNVLSPEKLSDHLPGLLGLVCEIHGGKVTKRCRKILRRLQGTQLVVGISVDPVGDKSGRILVNCVVRALSAIVFYGGSLMDRAWREVLAPDGTFDPEAEID